MDFDQFFLYYDLCIQNIKDMPAVEWAEIYDNHCTDSFCVAIGSYGTTDSIYPLLLTSNDNGSHWQFIKNINVNRWRFDAPNERINIMTACKIGQLTSGLLYQFG